MTLPRSSPEAQGVARDGVRALFAALDARLDSMHGITIVRHGRIVAEASWAPYELDAPHQLYSVSKSFTATAVGFAVAEGLLSVDDRLIELFPDDAPADPSPRLAELRVRHLLTMTTGHLADSMEATAEAGDGSWVASFLALPLDADPGSTFVYDTGASYVLSALVQRLTGQRLLDYLTPRLLEPLGIFGARWEQDPHGIDLGGFGLSITTRDIAAFGEFLLRRGRVGERQLLPAEWIDTASSALVPNAGEGFDWRQGYGYQLWRSRHGYRGDGAFGQFCLVLPEYDAVIAITGSLANMQTPLDLVWAQLEAMFPTAAHPSEGVGESEIARFEVRSPDGAPTSPMLTASAGARFRLEPGSGFETLALEAHPEGTSLLVTGEGRDDRIVFGAERWIPGVTALALEPGTAIAARGRWAEETVFRGRVLGTDGPHGVDHELRIDGDELVWTTRELVSFAPIVSRITRGRRG